MKERLEFILTELIKNYEKLVSYESMLTYKVYKTEKTKIETHLETLKETLELVRIGKDAIHYKKTYDKYLKEYMSLVDIAGNILNKWCYDNGINKLM